MDSFGAKLRTILTNTGRSIVSEIKGGNRVKRADSEFIEMLINSLVKVDISHSTALKIMEPVKNRYYNRNISREDIRRIIKEESYKILKPFAYPIDIEYNLRPQIVAVCGLNGAGKTTTIGKMAHMLNRYSWKVTVAACDLTRASASKQLQTFVEGSGTFVVKQENENEKPTQIARRAIDIATKNLSDILLVDTAGYFPNEPDGIKELGMILDSISLARPGAPHNVVLVMDANNGQNAKRQVSTFKGMAEVTGMVLTKLDTAVKGGILLSVVDNLKIPVHGIGIGSSIDDLQDFSALEFAEGISSGLID